MLLMCEIESRSVMSNSLGLYGPYSQWNSPVQNTGVGSYSLLQGIFPTQGSNTGLLRLLHWQVGVFLFCFFLTDLFILIGG